MIDVAKNRIPSFAAPESNRLFQERCGVKSRGVNEVLARLLVGLIVLLALPLAGRAATTAITLGTYSDFNNNTWTLAFEFSPTHNISVTTLGSFFPSGATDQHGVTIWDTSGNVLATTAVSGTGAEGFVFAAIPPLALIAGTSYVIGANTQSDNYALMQAGPPPTASEINYTGHTEIVCAGVTPCFPGTSSSTSTTDFGPNFQFVDTGTNPTISPSTVPSGTVNLSYGSITLTAQGGSGNYVWSATGLPAGITLSPTTGVLSGIPTTAGTFPAVVTVTDQSDSLAGHQNYTFTIAQAPQTITFAPLSDVTFGAAPFGVTATASSGLQVLFTSGTPAICTVAVATVSLVAGGLCTITASQPGNANYLTAPNLPRSFTVHPASQTITFAPLSDVTLGVAPFPLTATASSGLPVVFSSGTPAVCTVAVATVTLVATGTCTISASQPGNATYLPALNVTWSFTVHSGIVPLTLTCTPATGPSAPGTPYSATCVAAGGTPPYAFTVGAGALPAGLTLNASTGAIGGTPAASGAYNYTVEVLDSQNPPQTATQAYRGSIASAITVSPSFLNFHYRLGDATAPDPQGISAFSTPSGIGLTAAASTVTGGNWLVVNTPAGATTPGVIQVSINTSVLGSSGSFNGAVAITPGGGGLAVNVPVTLRVDPLAPPQLSAAPLSESFALTQGSSTGGEITVSNSGGGTLQFAVTTDQPGWLTATTAGSATSDLPGIVGFNINSTTLNPGLNIGHITIADLGSSNQAVATINVAVTPNTTSIQLSQTGLNFTADAAGSAPPAQSVTVSNPAGTPLNWNATAVTVSGGNWLNVAPSGNLLIASIDPTVLAGLSPGPFYGTLNVTAAGASNSPQTISVLLTINPAGTKGSGITFSSGGLTLTGTAGGAPVTGQVTMFNPSTTASSYSTTAVMNQGTGWLSVQGGASGTLVPGTNTLTIKANAGAVTAGVFKGVVTVAFDDGTTGVIGVVLIAGSGGASPSATAKQKPQLISVQPCIGNKPGYLIPNFTQPLGNSETQVAVGQIVQARIVDDCNHAVTSLNGGAQVTFGNGDPALTLTDTGNGIWEATWTPANAGASGTLQVVALASGAAPTPLTGGSSISTAISAASPTGAAQLIGVVNAAAGTTATPQIVAPGSFVAVYGNLIASGAPSLATVLPLPLNMGSAQLLLGGQLLPLSYTSPGQVNALIPQNLNPNASYTLVVKRGATQSVPIQLTVVGLQPGIYTQNQYGTEPGVVQIANTALLAQPAGAGSRPVQSGVEYITIYATGLGPVVGTKGEPPPADGAPAALPAIYQTKATVTATIGGVTVPASFAGLTPTLTALYQVNVPVPAGVPTGDAVQLYITATAPDGSKATSNPVTIAVR
jgi:uncharacterized protein (TIGR03437 family)